ncbi:protein timeless homolog [Microplitis mediator]|uniref:protein timeless homolog n=1 Tax=Microplitis mediator TaxID=375433 RepID=UPI0025532436|nr:protein timeless homolog [Microplitis mediator]XP_057326748.1 protein timeless homolog [Microplitis mediator]
MADYISAELAATCDALGYYDGATYHLDSDALNVIKDLIKYLKRDDDTHTVRRYLGQAKLLETDLIQILIQHSSKSELWDVLLRLMINLTSPALMFYNEELPAERTNRNYYLQLVSYLQGYKKALTDDRLWTVVSNRLGKILKIDTSERGEENELIIERILTLIRNVLQVPPHDNDKRADNDATVHDEVLFALHASGIVDLLLFIASNSSEQQFHVQIIEIIALMLREQNASKLAVVGLERTAEEKAREEAKLLAVRQKEITEKMEKMKKYSGSRHSRFGGTFVVQNMKAIGDNQMICHKPFEKIEALEFSRDKGKMKKPKNRVYVEPSVEERMSALSVRLFLKEFCVEFLIGAYNPVMRYAKSFIIGDSADKSDGIHYFWALRFFMEFNRHYKFQVKYVSETVSTETFYLVQRQMEQYYELLMADKKKTAFWLRRLHETLKAYQELLHTLGAMDKTLDKGVRDSSKVIKSNIFYVPEYRETILGQLLSYNGLKMSRNYLVDLITTVHIFLKMLEQFCAHSRNVMVAKSKAKRRKGTKKKNKPGKEREQATAVQKSLDERWDDAGPELSAVMQDGTIPDVIPFDATLDTPIEDQKSDAMKRIQKLLRKKEFEEAVGLLRASRAVWPENDCFGKPDIPVEEEFLALREIFFADLGVQEEAEKQNEDVESFLNNEGGEIEDENDEENEEEDNAVEWEETKFDFKEFIHRFANVKVVKAVTVLLKTFEKNSMELNRYIIKMLHRIAWDCKMPGMIFQASIFRVFQRILDSKHHEHKELQKFASFIIRQFAEVAQKNRKAYMELLFWKNTREATEMVDGYDAANAENKKISRAVWSEAEEDELRTLFMEHQTNKYPQDLIDWLLENIISDNRTRRGIIKKLKEMYLIVNSKEVRNEVQKRLPKEWGEEEIAQLKEMWENVKNDDDPVDLIYGGLRIKRPKPRIKEKLLELGLAKDPKELRKKRTKKNKSKSDGLPKASWETRSDSEESASSSDDEDSSDTENTGRHPGSSTNSARPSTANKKLVKKKNKKRQPTIIYSDAQLSGLLKDVIDNNMSESLEWIKESLEEALEDRDEESTDGIPLVPITDYSSAAMESPTFMRFLRASGIEPPSNEQEAYWRIPATMLSSTIRKRCDLIASALVGNFVIQEPSASEKIQINSDSDSSDEETQHDIEKIKEMFKKKSKLQNKSKGIASTFLDSSSDEDTGRSLMKDKSLLIDKNEEEEINNGKEKEKKGRNKSKVHGGKLNSSRIKSILNSSDSEMEVETDKITENNSEVKRIRSENSDTETPVMKKRRVIDSDDDEEEEKEEGENENKKEKDQESNFDKLLESTKTKQSRRIISDDESDDPKVEEPRRSKSRKIFSDDED